MELRLETSRREVSRFNAEELRREFLIPDLFVPNQVHLTYSIYDRMIIGGAQPILGRLALPNPEELKANYFLERRELGIINIGGPGQVWVNGKAHALNRLDGMYVGKGQEELSFESLDAEQPALFYLLSAPAHASHPVQVLRPSEIQTVELGSQETANARSIYKYIHMEGMQSCQLVMGLTQLKPGSIWNTMPAHVHTRRMEAYLYFDVDPQHAVLHLMGEAQETKHLWVQNHQAVISPPWSIHSGAGTRHYSFIWGMAGENKDYTDMDFSEITQLR